MKTKLHPRLAKARAISTAEIDDEVAASELTQFELGELVGIDDRGVRRLLDPERVRADRLDLLVAIRRLRLAAAGKEQQDESGHGRDRAIRNAAGRGRGWIHAAVDGRTGSAAVADEPPAAARVGSGAAPQEELVSELQQIIMGPANRHGRRFDGGKPIARDTPGVTAPSSRASHEGPATPVISASEQVVSPGSVGSFPVELGGAHQVVSQQTCSFGNESAGSRPRGNVGATDLLRAAAGTQAPGSRSAGALERTGKAVLGRAANLTGAPASHVSGSPDVESAAAAAQLAPRGRRAA